MRDDRRSAVPSDVDVLVHGATAAGVMAAVAAAEEGARSRLLARGQVLTLDDVRGP